MKRKLSNVIILLVAVMGAHSYSGEKYEIRDGRVYDGLDHKYTIRHNKVYNKDGDIIANIDSEGNIRKGRSRLNDVILKKDGNVYRDGDSNLDNIKYRIK